MTPTQFQEYTSQGFTQIPLMRTILADLETPLSAYMKLADGPYSYLFESVEGDEKWGRYSIIGLPSETVIKVTGHNIVILKNGEIHEQITNESPLQLIRDYSATFKTPSVEGLPLFTGGLVGYFGYETIHYIEPSVANASKPDPIGSPDIVLMVSKDVLVFDNVSNKLMIITHVDPSEPTSARKWLGALARH